MTKLIITPFDKDGNELTRGKTSIASDASSEDQNAKILYAAKRAGKKVAMVRTSDGWDSFFKDGALIGSQPTEETESPLPTKGTTAALDHDGTVLDTEPDGPTPEPTHEDHRRGQKPPSKPVILTLLHALEAAPQDGGSTIDELVQIVAAATGRDPDGVKATIRTQLSRLRSDGHKVIRASSTEGSRYRVAS